MSDQHSHFIVPVRYYVGTFVALLILTVLTVVVARLDFGSMNLFIAMVVAVIKAGLVASVFMGLKWDSGFNRLAFLSGILFIIFFFAFIFADYAYREFRPEVELEYIKLESPVTIVEDTHHHGAGHDDHGADAHDEGH